jgi:type IV pilus assembly protein PilP
MRLRREIRGCACAIFVLLTACSGQDLSDLDAFMAEKLARPGGVIPPIPTFEAYEAFSYGAASLRSPFERPIGVRALANMQASRTVRPDVSRPREFLEQYAIEGLSMVGNLSRSGADWALIRDSDGGVHRVRMGNFLGRDHGRIVEMADTHIGIVEIVSDGTEDGWVERPRTIRLSGM